MLRIIFALGGFFGVMVLSSCCEPAHKNSSPYVVDSLFQETYGRDIDFIGKDSAYYPIYTFGIQNTGTADDNFTLQLRYGLTSSGWTSGFDITKHVPAGAVVLFQTPTPFPDSLTENATYAYVFPDTGLNIDEIYYGLSFQNTDSAEIHALQPTLSIVYGSIDNGPEGCNTRASTMSMSVNSLPVR
jgi:hypothetical protein